MTMGEARLRRECERRETARDERTVAHFPLHTHTHTHTQRAEEKRKQESKRDEENGVWEIFAPFSLSSFADRPLSLFLFSAALSTST